METEATNRPRSSLAVISLVLFVTFLDNTVVAAALANVQTDLHAGIQALQWVVSGYALTFAGLMLAFGTIGDRFGRRRVMVAGLAVFTAGSLLGAFAVSSGMLIAARVIMGVGAAASEPGTLSMIRQLFRDPADRAQALGVWSAISGLALAAGPLIGGILVGIWSWRLVFVFNVVVGVIAMVGVQWVLPESVSPSRRKLDAGGFLLAAIGVSAATFAIIFGETEGFGTWWIVALFAGAAVALGAFIRTERRAEEPVLDLRFFRQGRFTSGMTVAFTGFFATFAVFFFIPLFIELLGMRSPYVLALDFTPMAVALILASVWSGKWIGRVGPAQPTAIGGVLAAAGIFLTDAFLSQSSGIELFGWSLSLVGAGLGIVMVGATAAVLGSVPPERSGMAASAVNTSRELGAVTGVSVLGAIINAQLTSNLLHRLAQIPDLPASLRQTVIVDITTGAANTSAIPKSLQPLVNQVLGAANASFSSGLDIVMALAGSLMLASALLSAVLARGRAGDGTPPAGQPDGRPVRAEAGGTGSLQG